MATRMEKGVPLLIAFGANLEPLDNLEKGLALLHNRIGLRAISTVYRTAPLGSLCQPDFFNGAVLSEKVILPRELKLLLRQIEALCGRIRQGDPYGPRTLDLDVAMMGGLVSADPLLPLPDPEILHRPFLLKSIAELAPDLHHPQAGQSLATLAAALPDTSHAMRPDPTATRRLRQAIPNLQDPAGRGGFQ